MKLIIFILIFISRAHALHLSKNDFCLSQKNAEILLLASQFKVEGQTPHPALVSTIAQVLLEFQIQGPMVLHFTEYTGPRKVWSMELSKVKHIYFSKNAIDLLLGFELQKVAEEVCSPTWTGRWRVNTYLYNSA